MKKKLKELEEVNLGIHDAVYRTNVDGIPYVLIDESKDELVIKSKYAMKGNQGMYTLTSVNTDRKELEFKLDKVLDLTERLVDKVQDFYDGFGIKKTAKCNYLIGGTAHLELDVEGKLSKNQTIQMYSQIIKITDLIKLEDKTIEIKGEKVRHGRLVPVYPYKEYKDILGWYYSWGDTLLKKVREFNERRNGVVNVQYIKELINIDDEVIFKLQYRHDSPIQLQDGTVTAIYNNGVLVHYLYGYKSECELVKWEDLVIIGDKENGEYFKMSGYSGKGVILNRECLNI